MEVFYNVLEIGLFCCKKGECHNNSGCSHLFRMHDITKKNTETQIYGKFQIRHNQTSACSDCYGLRPLIWDEQFLSLFLCLCFSQDHLPLNASSTSLPPSATVFFSPFLDLSPQLPETTIIKLLKCCLAAINQWR